MEKHMEENINFFIIQEIPFNDPYNRNYEILEKIKNLKEFNESSVSSESASSYEQERNEILTCLKKRGENEAEEEQEEEEEEDEKEEEKEIEKGVEEEEKKKEKDGVKKEGKDKYEIVNEFLQQCEFSSDGSCYYTISNGNRIRLFFTDYALIKFWEQKKEKGQLKESLFDTNKDIIKEDIKNKLTSQELYYIQSMQNDMPESEKVSIKEGIIDKTLDGHIYDCKLYPYLDWNNLNTCFYAIASKNNPVHIFSTYTDTLLISLKILNESMDFSNCYSLCFHPIRNWILCATNRNIQVFDLQSPKTMCEKRILSTRKGKGQKGIISSISYKTEGFGQYEIYGIGDYNNCLYIYADNCDHKNDYVMKFKNEDKENSKGNGITHIKWYNEYTILSGSRNSSSIYLYDLRNSTTYVQKYYRLALTNQKYMFDIFNHSLICGDIYGYINIYDIKTGVLKSRKLINKYSPIISVHKNIKYPFLLTGSGTRRFYENGDNDNAVDTFARTFTFEDNNTLKWKYNNTCFPCTSKYMNSVCTILIDW